MADMNKVTDTPGLCDTHWTDAEIGREVRNSLSLTEPGPHIILMVFRCDRRFTGEEYRAYTEWRRRLGKGITTFTIVVFNGIDSLADGYEEQQKKLKQELENASTDLRVIVTENGGRYIGVNNLAGPEDRNQQAMKIFGMMKELVTKNEERHFIATLPPDEEARTGQRGQFRRFLSFRGRSRPTETLRMVLLGRTGAGKSSLGSMLKGEEIFRVGRGMSSGTERCQWAEFETLGYRLQVTDTPGLFDTRSPNLDVKKEIARSLALVNPGPHVVLLVLRCDQRYTQEWIETYRDLKALFGSDITKFMIVVFAGMDQLTPSRVKAHTSKALAEEINKAGLHLNEVIKDASNRYTGVNNRATGDERRRQKKLLLRMIGDLVKSNGHQYFTSTLVHSVGVIVEERVEDRMRQGHLTHEQAEREIRQEFADERADEGFWRTLFRIVKEFCEGKLGVDLDNLSAKRCSVM